MILPLGDESYTRRVPVVNISILAANIIVFAAVNVFSSPNTTWEVFKGYGVVPGNLKWYQFFTCMFLNGGWMHIIGNMWFLWVFGDAVENRIGHVKYLIFYLAAGVGASAFYLLLTPRNMIPCVGASGAIFGVVGAYAVLFPRNDIKMFYWIGWIWAGTFHIKAMWIIGFWFLEQIGMYFLMKDFGGGGVAHAAHLGGGIVGVAVAIVVRGWLPEPEEPEGWDTGPRYAYGEAPTAFEIPGRSAAPAFAPLGTPVPTPTTSGVVDFIDGELEPLDEVSQAFVDGDVDEALQQYRERTGEYGAEPLSSATQMQVANAYFERAEFDEALEAYQLYLGSYATESDAPFAKFRAAVVLSRRLDRAEEAGKLLVEVAMEHPDSEVTALAREEIGRIRAARV